MSRILLVQPPFFRLVGSHNDRGPLELAYLASHLADMGHECTILNQDYTGARIHCSWGNLYQRSYLLGQAVADDSAAIWEAAECIMGHDADSVVLAAGDSLTPWVDLGNAWTTARLARILRSSGMRVIGTGVRLAAAPPQVTESFDAVIAALPLHLGAQVIAGNPPRGTVPPAACSPLISADVTGSRYDVVMTSFGCIRSCSFCDAAQQKYRELEIASVVTDIAARSASHLDIGDAIFMPNRNRCRALIEALAGLSDANRTYSSELSIDLATPKNLEVLAEFGVCEIKVGVESADAMALQLMNKRSSRADIRTVCQTIRSFGMALTVYILLGGPIPDAYRAAVETLRLCQSLPATDYVINVWAYNRPGARPADSHFSWDIVEEYGLEDIMPEFWALQPGNKNSIGRIVDISTDTLEGVSRGDSTDKSR